jgi:hypothetical protein
MRMNLPQDITSRVKRNPFPLHNHELTSGAVWRPELPPSNLAFVLFLGRDLDIRIRWNLPPTLGRLSTSGTKLMLENASLFDYADFKPNDYVRIETGVQTIPQWK